MVDLTSQQRALLTAALAVVTGVERQGYDLSLTQYDDRGWRATFYVSGMGLRERGTRRPAPPPRRWLEFGKAGESITQHSVDTPRQTGKCNAARRPSRLSLSLQIFVVRTLAVATKGRGTMFATSLRAHAPLRDRRMWRRQEKTRTR